MKILIEGRYYPFKVLSEIEGVDGVTYFKLADPNGIKHLLKKKLYEKYGIKPGMTINCHIDKINCSGKIFIEPEHPLYENEGIYDFDVCGKKNENGDEFILISDVFDNILQIPAVDFKAGIKQGDKVKCKVITVKKGIPLVLPLNAVPDFSGFIEGRKYSFKVTGVKKYSDRLEFYILVDGKGKQFPLRKKFYRDYGFKQGDTVKCTFKRHNKEAFLEPVHPFYNIGESYDFTVIGEDFIYKYPEGKEEAVVLFNKYGKEILIPKKNTGNANFGLTSVRCTVKDIIKGQPVLDCSAV